MSDSSIEMVNPRARDCLLSNVYAVERIATGMRWAEGPVWFGDMRMLLWSDVAADTMYRWTEDGHVSVFRAASNHANGNTRDREGRLVTCEHATRRVTRTEPDGRLTVLADACDGLPLNSPNDVVVARDGSIWFSDPDYGIMTDYEGGRAESSLGACNVFRIDPVTRAVTIASREYMRPNGLAFSADERRLYVADSGGSHTPGGPLGIYVHDVDNGRLGPRRLFVETAPAVADGFRIDDRGYLWTSAGRAVVVYAPDGVCVARIPVPENVSNLTFGGRHRNRLFVTATSSVYAIYTAARGIAAP